MDLPTSCSTRQCWSSSQRGTMSSLGKQLNDIKDSHNRSLASKTACRDNMTAGALNTNLEDCLIGSVLSDRNR